MPTIKVVAYYFSPGLGIMIAQEIEHTLDVNTLAYIKTSSNSKPN